MLSICIIEDVREFRWYTQGILFSKFPENEYKYELLSHPKEFAIPSSPSEAPKIIISDLWFGSPGDYDDGDVNKILTKFIPLILGHVILPLSRLLKNSFIKTCEKSLSIRLKKCYGQ